MIFLQDSCTEVNTVAEAAAMYVEVQEVKSGRLHIMAAEETYHYKVRWLEYFICQSLIKDAFEKCSLVSAIDKGREIEVQLCSNNNIFFFFKVTKKIGQKEASVKHMGKQRFLYLSRKWHYNGYHAQTINGYLR